MSDAALLQRRLQEDTFASVLAQRLGPPGEEWEKYAALLGLSWERFLALAACKLPGSEAAVRSLAQAFGLGREAVTALARGDLINGGRCSDGEQD